LITNEVYVEIKLLRKDGWSLRQIAEETGYAVNTVRRAGTSRTAASLA
jgi:lambda repressor-like predicted transcriptional regulator